jgi:hypothetical protein
MAEASRLRRMIEDMTVAPPDMRLPNLPCLCDHDRRISGERGRTMVQKAQPASAEAVRPKLSRILGSPHFDASERILRQVVREALAGRTDRVANEVFGRILGSIVRIEAGRLRRSRQRYYLTDGRADQRGRPGRCARGPVRPRRGLAAAGDLGFADEATDAVAALRAVAPHYGAGIVDDLESRRVAQQLVPPIVAGLGQAGPPIPAPATSAS